jgi:hypothetical protein
MKIFESFKDYKERFTAGEEEIWDLNEPIKEFVKQFPKEKDIFFTNDNKAHVTKRGSNLTFHGKDGRTDKSFNIDNVKAVWGGYEEEFYEVNDYFKMLKSIYHGRKLNIKPINIIESQINEYEKSGDMFKHKHINGLTIKLLEPTNKGWKVEQTELFKGYNDTKLRTPKVKINFFSSAELKDLFEPLVESENIVEAESDKDKRG